MRGVLAAAVLVALLLAGCGGSDDSANDSQSAQVEASVKAQLAKGGGGVVDLGNDPPKLITCRKDGGQWHCKVTTTKGRSMLCLVDEKSERKVPPTPICGPMDN